ncbi:MAG TPA: hypothetical protein DFR83_25785 [Deltaproteobacteria bacterium]|nr:hypothetical protein [Deltaproteobacteria bacterium]
MLGAGLALACAGGGDAPTKASEPSRASDADSGLALDDGCNGHPLLCDRRVQDVTFPGTHNSMSNADAGWLAPNQQHGLSQQLEDGIRGLMLDTYLWEGDLFLCHASCSLGAQPLSEGLAEIADFLDAHPREVVQIIFEDAISLEDTRAAIDAADLGRRLYVWSESSEATLRALIEAETTLIVGLESGAADGQGLHGAWDLWTDTPYSFADASEFSCAPNRGDDTNALFLVNHWIGNPLPNAPVSREVNAEAVLLERARACADERGRPVNFLGVDFYNEGDLFSVVRQLNGLPEPG